MALRCGARKLDRQKSRASTMPTRANSAPLVVYTIGHSTRILDGLVELLNAHGVKQLADVRTIPRSRRNPQFNMETLPEALQGFGIGYVQITSLGGLRHPRPDSRNTAWQNASFRGFADYMETAEFAAGVSQLIHLARRRPTAIMCAEAVPWSCHRSLIADALVVRAVRVEHILSGRHCKSHILTPFAKVRGLKIGYPGLLHQECERL
jgi:uncharacterized protein (DUF488 family)